MNQDLVRTHFLPVTQVGEILIARHKETLDLVLVFQTQLGPVSQSLSDEVATDLAVQMIREAGRRGERTAVLLRNLQQSLEASQKGPTDETTTKADSVSVVRAGGNGAGAGHSDNGGRPTPNKEFSPTIPREKFADRGSCK